MSIIMKILLIVVAIIYVFTRQQTHGKATNKYYAYA